MRLAGFLIGYKLHATSLKVTRRALACNPARALGSQRLEIRSKALGADVIARRRRDSDIPMQFRIHKVLAGNAVVGPDVNHGPAVQCQLGNHFLGEDAFGILRIWARGVRAECNLLPAARHTRKAWIAGTLILRALLKINLRYRYI